MPYTVKKSKGHDTQGGATNYNLVNSQTGKVVSHHKTKADAEAAKRIRLDAHKKK